MKKQNGIKSGFTLIELLVVVTILGLLAIVVLPAFTAGGDKRLLRGAADRLDTHLKHAAARATGKPRGSAVWLDATSGTGVIKSAVFDLNFSRMPKGEELSGTVEAGNPSAKFALLSPDINRTIGSVVKFDMVPTEFRITSVRHISFPDGQTQYNCSFPNSPSTPIEFTVYEPPFGPRIASRPTVMPDRVCVDLASSTIGVYGFSNTVTPFQEDIDRDNSQDSEDQNNNWQLDTGEDINGNNRLDYEDVDRDGVIDTYDQASLVFDVQGRLSEVWASSSDSITTPAQKRFRITPSKPVALLVTLGYQSGLAFTSYSKVTEDNPGAGWQNPDAFWVVIDPKTGRNLIVENNFESADLADAQAFIVDELRSQSSN